MIDTLQNVGAVVTELHAVLSEPDRIFASRMGGYLTNAIRSASFAQMCEARMFVEGASRCLSESKDHVSRRLWEEYRSYWRETQMRIGQVQLALTQLVAPLIPPGKAG